MDPLPLDSLLPLTCTRSGDCCHGHRIGVTAWEIAALARQLGRSQREVRDAHIGNGGTTLRFDGELDAKNRHACTFFSGTLGCTVHPARPLACRVYPLARRRAAGRIFYTFAGEQLPCLTRCPDVVTLPQQRVGEWLDSQGTDPGQAAHDAYGHLVWGLMVTAASIAAAGALGIDGIATEGSRRAALTADERVPLFPPAWFDLLTIPELAVDPGDPTGFVAAHAERLRQAISGDFCMPAGLHETALLVLSLAIHMAPCVGIDQAALIEVFVAEARTRATAAPQG
jgi:Fe-S-cluster containining protein